MARGRGTVDGGDRQPLLALQGRAVGQLGAHAPGQNVRRRGRATPRNPLRVGERTGQGQFVLAGARARPPLPGAARTTRVGARRLGGVGAGQVEPRQLVVRQPGRKALQARLRLRDPGSLGAAEARVPAAPEPALRAAQVGARRAHVLRQEGHEARRLRLPQDRARRQEGPAERRVQRQRRQGAAERGGSPGLVDGPQGGQTLPGGLPRALGWSVEQGELLHRRAPGGDLEARVRQVLRRDARRGLRGPARHVDRVHDAHGDARAGARGSARTLLQARERGGDRHQGRQRAPRVEARLARQARVHHDGHARNRQRRLGNRGRQDDAATARRGQRPVLLGGAQLAVQRQHVHSGQAQRPAHGLDLAHARQEHEERPLSGRDRLLDRARHVRQELAAHAHAIVPDRPHGLHAARRGSVTQLQRVIIARNINERRFLARRLAQPGNRARGLQRRRREGDEQVLAQRRTRIQGEGQGQVRVQVALVKLVDDDPRHARQLRVALQATQRHARRHHLHARAPTHPRIPAHRVTDLAPHLLAQQASDPAGGGPRGHPARLGDEHPPGRGLVPRQRDRDGGRQQRRLARARGSGHHGARTRARRRRNIGQRTRHRQLRRV